MARDMQYAQCLDEHPHPSWHLMHGASDNLYIRTPLQVFHADGIITIMIIAAILIISRIDEFIMMFQFHLT
jgi:hypothetical protein